MPRVSGYSMMKKTSAVRIMGVTKNGTGLSMPDTTRHMLVTSALPYANGPVHLGHLLEYIQTDIWVRFQKMRNTDCVYVCADDAHGTAIMLKAEEYGITPEQQIEQVRAEHERDFADFLIAFDEYYSTHSAENRELAELIYTRNRDRGYIAQKTITQLFDPERGMFLADRFVKGTCPKCRAADQYGDNCESCGATYTPGELIDPRSALSGATPEERETTQLFFDLPQFEGMLRDWLDSGAMRDSVANKLREWLEDGLQPWDISRESPYFGFEIPGWPGKYFYVWMDAPVGYMAALKHYCDRVGRDFSPYWAPDSQYEVHHFIGKDIINFHGLFWPAMLDGAGFGKPTALHAHGFVTVNGAKMSKSRGTFITARHYMEHLDPEYLRYYFAAKMVSGVEDFDLNLDDFVTRVNSDLIGKVINIASRTANFIRKGGGYLGPELDHPALVDEARNAAGEIAELYETREFGKAMRAVMALADQANAYVNEREPWKLAKQDGREDEVRAICTTALNVFRILVVYLKPVLPRLAEKSEKFLAIDPLQWGDEQGLLLDHPINKFKPLMQRVTADQVQALVQGSAESAGSQDSADAADAADAGDQITMDEFAKIDLRVARVQKAESVEGADKLLKLILDVGELGERTVFAGVRARYTPEALEDRLVAYVANLQPRRMKFGTSEGMVLAAGPGDDDLHVLHPDTGAQPGMRIQ
jgi:methionyl-tRNA synthetase